MQAQMLQTMQQTMASMQQAQGLVINCCNKIRYNKDIGILCLHSDRMYDNLILGIHTMSIWFWP
jgi:hypothetical protein